jgi:hypothetical protein
MPLHKSEVSRQALVLDGHHRIAKAIDDKLEHLEAYLLTHRTSRIRF